VGVEVGQAGLEQEVVGAGNRVAVMDRPGLLFGEVVAEGVVELLGGQGQRGSYELAVTTVESPEQRIGVRVGSGPRFEMFVYMDDVDETLAAAARRCDRRH
jgi:hypothetical protein